METIKFRAYDTDDKVMRSWGEIDFTKDIGDDYYLVGYKASAVSTKYDHEQIIMQYTGLKDRSGVEVYFNDIVEDEYGHRYEVVFEGDCLRCNGIRRKKGGHKPKNRWFGRDLKIIGNRYENPELLKEQNK